jgi:hypothetical protein
MIATITERVPKAAVSAILPIFDQLSLRSQNCLDVDPTPIDFDWAVHPGGAEILRGAQRSMSLSDDHIRASLKVYRSHGNSSSPSVLIVLDELRTMGKGRDNVVATSFGPGMTIEMCMLKRCRVTVVAPRLQPKAGKSGLLSVLLPVQFARLRRWYISSRWPSRVGHYRKFSFVS